MAANTLLKEDILFENDNFFVLSKPYGVSTLDDRHKDKSSMILIARAYHPLAQACHRLDKETSGILVFAKHPEAYRHMAIQFESRKVHKIYHAVVTGVHRFQEIEVDRPITVQRSGQVRIDWQNGKPSLTIFNSLEVFKHATLVQCEPVTGRMHQIRVHLASLKAPILADEMYGGSLLYLSQIKRKFKLAKNTEEEPLIKRVALHAYQIRFLDMDQQSVIEVTAPYSKDMHALLRQLQLHDQ
jgi:23S rRNA pseudouridine955/2504/2580 synthase